METRCRYLCWRDVRHRYMDVVSDFTHSFLLKGETISHLNNNSTVHFCSPGCSIVAPYSETPPDVLNHIKYFWLARFCSVYLKVHLSRLILVNSVLLGVLLRNSLDSFYALSANNLLTLSVYILAFQTQLHITLRLLSFLIVVWDLNLV